MPAERVVVAVAFFALGAVLVGVLRPEAKPEPGVAELGAAVTALRTDVRELRTSSARGQGEARRVTAAVERLAQNPDAVAAVASAAEQTVAEEPPESEAPSPKAIEAGDKLVNLVETATTSGRWTNGDRDQVRRLLAEADPERAGEAIRALARSINEQKVMVATDGPPI